MAYGKVLDALGDATRRSVLEILLRQEASVGDIAAQLSVTRPAVSQHLKLLREAGLVRFRVEGTRRIYQVEANGLRELRAWVDEFLDD